MGAVIVVSVHYIPLNGGIVELLLPILVGVTVYTIHAALTKSSEMALLTDFLKSKFKRGERAE